MDRERIQIRIELKVTPRDGILFHELLKLPAARGSRRRAERVIELAKKGLDLELSYLGRGPLPTVAQVTGGPQGERRRRRQSKVVEERQHEEPVNVVRIWMSISGLAGEIFDKLIDLPIVAEPRTRCQRLLMLAQSGLTTEILLNGQAVMRIADPARSEVRPPTVPQTSKQLDRHAAREAAPAKAADPGDGLGLMELIEGDASWSNI